MEAIASRLANLRLFSALPEEDLDQLASVMTEGYLPAGETLFRAQDPGGAMFLVLDGLLDVVQEENGEQRMLRQVAPGDAVGEASLLDDAVRSATVLAALPTSYAMLSQNEFMKVAQRFSEHLMGKLRDIAATIRAGHIDIIRHLPLFEGLPEEALADISQKLTGDSIEQGEIVFEKGSPANTLYVITRGWFKIVTVDGQGEELVLNQVGPGEAIGEMSLIDAEPRSASFIAMTPGEVVRLKREDFLEVLVRSPYLAQHMLKKMSARMRFSTTYIEQAIEFARSIAEGDYNFVMNQIQSTQSAIGEKGRSDQARANELLTAFFKMVEGVREREEALQQQVRQLTIQIDQSKRKEEFESVTKSEFYQDLKTKAAQLRGNSSKDEE